MLKRRFAFLLSQDLLAEYRAVLLRLKIQKLHGLSSEEVDRLLTEIAANAVVRDPDEASAEPPDEGDRHLWNLLETYAESVLVTVDGKLLESPMYAGRILSPREFMESL
jgi:predicted nucleic acid-binding protein